MGIDKETLKKYYEEEGREYDVQKAMYEVPGWASTPHRKRKFILSYLKDCLDKSKSFLDVGCAEGLYVHFAASLCSLSVGVDISEPRIKKAEKGKKFKHERFYVGNAEELPFEDGSFDVVICTETLEHVLDDKKAIGELSRVTKKHVLIVVPTAKQSLGNRIRKLMDPEFSVIDVEYALKEMGRGHIHDYDLKSVSESLLNCYLKPVEIRSITTPIPIIRGFGPLKYAIDETCHRFPLFNNLASSVVVIAEKLPMNSKGGST
jgi:ubiquinone/menaquinone biosynthesis C-methylase UbiE